MRWGRWGPGPANLDPKPALSPCRDAFLGQIAIPTHAFEVFNKVYDSLLYIAALCVYSLLWFISFLVFICWNLSGIMLNHCSLLNKHGLMKLKAIQFWDVCFCLLVYTYIFYANVHVHVHVHAHKNYIGMTCKEIITNSLLISSNCWVFAINLCK